MATLSPISSFLRFLIGCFVFICLILCSSAARDAKSYPLPHAHTVVLSSLLPAATCSSSTKGHNNNNASSVLKLVHKHGPCNELPKSKTQSTSSADENHIQLLKLDQARASYIQSLILNYSHNHNNNNKNYRLPDPLTQSDATTIPAKSGLVIGSANYIVTVGLGTPAKQLSLAFDTASDLTWTQCKPCYVSCYKQNEEIFNPSLSTSYTNASCTSDTCSQLPPAGVRRGCDSGTCLYGIQYGDGSFTIGFLSKEKLTVSSTDVFEGFLFGCGQDNEGLFRGSAGLLGLGRNAISLVEQTAQKYNRVFSYCLPSTSSSTGYLSFGSGASAKGAKFTPLTTGSESGSFYGLSLVALNVGGRQLSIPASIFSNSGTIIDSGTVITRLPATAYAALRGAFRDAMKTYPLTKSSSSLLDTCYDFRAFKTVTYPTIGFVFGKGITVDVDASGIFFGQSKSQVCLAFAGNKDDSSIGIIGNVQQKRLQVVYDVTGGKIGFAPAGCS